MFLMQLEEMSGTLDKLGLPKERVEDLREELLEEVFSVEEGTEQLMEIDDPSFVSETYQLEKAGKEFWLTSGDIELSDGKHSEFIILMDMIVGPEGEDLCREVKIVYSKVYDSEPELSLERSKVEVSILKCLWEDFGFLLASTVSGLVPIDLPRDLVSPKTSQFYKDILSASEHAIETDILDPEAWLKKASALYFFGEIEKAEEALHRVLVLGPPVGWPYTALGYIHLQKGNEALARFLFQKADEALSKMPLLRGPLAVMDIVHPRGRSKKSRTVKGDWFDEGLCPNCDRRTWENIDGVKGLCPKCGYQYFRKDVEVPFRVLPTRAFYLVGEPIVLEVHVDNTLGLDLKVLEDGGLIQLDARGKDGASGWEEIETGSVLEKDVIPAKTRFSTQMNLEEAIPSDAPFWGTFKKGGILDIHGSFSAIIKDPPSKNYRRVEIFGSVSGTETVDILDLK
jgi:tetratricopeptide (TPR) repeat protein